jgi:hypothetical protein
MYISLSLVLDAVFMVTWSIVYQMYLDHKKEEIAASLIYQK